MTLDDVLRATGGRSVGASSHASIRGVCTDSRRAAPGDLFVALRGERFDGNEFIDEAVGRGASAVVCARGRGGGHGAVAVVEVDDTLRALGDLALAHRVRFTIPVVAITGSNGKTTTKELLRTILARACGADHVLANEGNLNNLIGMPMTLLQLDGRHAAAVLEMGMNAFGEIARLTEIARPTCALITCVGAAHLEGVGSIEGVARAKGELFAGLGADAVAVVNRDDPYVVEIARSMRARRIEYGHDAPIRYERVQALGLSRTRFDLVDAAAGRVTVDLPLGGRHNVQNALAAAACARVLGIALSEIAAGLAQAEPPPMRFRPEVLANGVVVVNDAYNANPSSLAAALACFGEGAEGRRLVVLGEMLELGAASAARHREAGSLAAALDPVLLCAYGAHASDVREGALEAGMTGEAVCVGDHEEIARAISSRWRGGDAVLVKGSRGAAMEKVVEALRRLAG